MLGLVLLLFFYGDIQESVFQTVHLKIHLLKLIVINLKPIEFVAELPVIPLLFQSLGTNQQISTAQRKADTA